jgi:glyoxylase-like metal-dependent hydrolase (beta-lactamase superfamily II)
MKKLALAAAAFLGLTGLQSPSAPKPLPELSLWRLDCGNFVIKDFNAFFSDTMAYASGKAKDIVASCYLIKNGDRYMLWDTGLEAAFIAKPQENAAQRVSLRTSILDQLTKLGVRPDQIEMIGISHYHFDHLGQAASFPKAKLIMGKGDLDVLRTKPTPSGMKPELLKPWLAGSGKVQEATGDVDLFGDGRVIMLRTPGHTPGHNALLVKLASGNVLLTGDLYHFTEQVLIKGVPTFNIDKLARNLRAKVIIQHEPADIAKLPAFPQAAR